jgi:16S rRNA (cytidine1402-2'-O)-methyltransferase
VATPIGNPRDITLRALSVLATVDRIAAEDTRTAARLIAHHGIAGRLVAYHDHNEAARAPELLAALRAGESIALIAEAGTPGISDPGYRLVSTAAAAGIRVVPLPGASALTAALSASGLPTDAFTFVGFLPKKAGERLRRIERLALEPRTILFYEAPQRLTALIDELLAAFGDRPAVLARELTKAHEEFLRGKLSAIRERLRARPEVRGECTLLVGGRAGADEAAWERLRAEARRIAAARRQGLGAIARELARAHGLPRGAVYAEVLKINAAAAGGPQPPPPEDKGDPCRTTS